MNHIADAEEVGCVLLRGLLQQLGQTGRLFLQRVGLVGGAAMGQADHLGGKGREGLIVCGNHEIIVHALEGLFQLAGKLANMLVFLAGQLLEHFLAQVAGFHAGLQRRLIGKVQLHAGVHKAVEGLALGLGLCLHIAGLALLFPGGDDGLFQQLQHAVEAGAAVAAALLVVEEHGLGQLLADAHDGVQCGEGILEHHGQLVAAQGVEVLLGDLQQILAVVDDFAAFHHGVARQDAHDGAGGDGLAGAGLSGDGKGFSLIEVEGNVPHGADGAVVRAEGDGQMTNLKLCHVTHPLLSTKD